MHPMLTNLKTALDLVRAAREMQTWEPGSGPSPSEREAAMIQRMLRQLVVEVGGFECGEEAIDAAVAELEGDSPDWDIQACPGCGCMPGDGQTEGCAHPDGCGVDR